MAPSLFNPSVALDPSIREFVADSLRRAGPRLRFVNGDDIVNGCRMVKTEAVAEPGGIV
jgi:hypothetical protein